MNEQKYPQLERLHILRTEALCSIRDRAFDGLQLFLSNYSDGIISGCKLHTTKTSITLGEGMILHNNFLYLIKDEMSVDYAPTEEYVMLKLIFVPEIMNESFLQRNVEITLSGDMNLSDNELELCRFKLKKSAVLRTDYTDFFDRVTEFDTVNAVNVQYAAPFQSTLSPEITLDFASTAKNYELDIEDYNFCLAALSGKIISAEQIAFYIERRLKTELPDKKNQTLYDNLCLILKEIISGRKIEVTNKGRKRREILLD